MNKPYVKQYNEKGEVINHIKGVYLHYEPNRAARRPKKQRFYGESNNTHLTVVKTAKFLRFRQSEVDKNGKQKYIEHYIQL